MYNNIHSMNCAFMYPYGHIHMYIVAWTFDAFNYSAIHIGWYALYYYYCYYN